MQVTVGELPVVVLLRKSHDLGAVEFPGAGAAVGNGSRVRIDK